MEYLNLDVESKIEHLMNWGSRKLVNETKLDFDNELAAIINNLNVRSFYLNNI